MAERYHLAVDGEPACKSTLVRAAEITADDIGGGFIGRCGHESRVDALLAAVQLRRVIGPGAPITICAGDCPVDLAERAYDAAHAN